MSTKFLTVLLLLSLSAHAAWTVGTDEKIDPRPLTWWRDTWAARSIELSRTNASSSGVTMTFKVRLSTDLPAGGVFEICYPSAFTAPSGSVSNCEIIS
mmetsp:Transcript_26229/g.4509  ORF Transcript_26229/g.4509 Transcript_26229/m.4509 type:complete len:98 (+) Transcript_26229:13-306(+)